MSTIKSLILGSAAVIAASAGAQAADLPVKAKAVQYVKICSLYGAGFYYIPGTDTCIKLGGYVQADANINAGNYNKPAWDETAGTAGAGVFGTGSRNSDYFTTRSRVQLNIDTRTATEYGVVRTYWSSNFEHSTGFGPSSGNLTMDYGFVQFAGFTFGKAASTFQTPWASVGANNNTSFLLGGSDNLTGITKAAYTWQFGNGLSAEVSVEDNKVITRAPVLNTSANVFGATAAAAAAAAGAYLGNGTIAGAQNGTAGQHSPDFVGNVRLDQAAFTAQLSGAVHNISANYYAAPAGTIGNETLGHPGDAWGWAIAGGLQLKQLPTGPGDKISLDFTYSEGAPKYVIGGVTANTFDKFSGDTNFVGSYQSLAAVNLYDGVYANGSGIEKTKVWGFRGGYVHNWTPNWETSVFGSYTKVDYNTNASAMICAFQGAARTAVGGGAATNGFTCNPDFAIWQIGTRTAWTPVQNLTFSGEFMYSFIDQNNTGSISTTGAAAANVIGTFKPNGVYDYKDQGILSGSLRVRRTW
ncbi:MAG: porin [Pseudomonadota bacterium]